jgi:hypothetical protein
MLKLGGEINLPHYIEGILMKMTVTLKQGSFFFLGDISIVGLKSSKELDVEQGSDTHRALLAAEATGVISIENHIFVEELVDEITIEIIEEVTPEVETESVEDESPMVEEPEVVEQKKAGRRIKKA